MDGPGAYSNLNGRIVPEMVHGVLLISMLLILCRLGAFYKFCLLCVF
jgi:hypothetical protein